MHTGFRAFLGAFTVLLLALVPAVLPVPGAVQPAMATGAELDKYLLLPDTSDASNALGDGVTADGGVIPDGTDFTVEAWVYPDSLNNPSVWHQILQQSGGNKSNYGRFGLNLKTSGNNSTLGYAGVQVIYDGVNLDTNSQAPDVNVFEDRWTHIAVSVDASAGEVTLFLNGAEVHSHNSGLNGTADVRAGGFTVGYFPFSDGTDRHFDGGIDQVKVWDGLLSESQVQQSMSSFDDTGVTSAPTLRALLDFNEDYADSQGAFTFATAGTVSRTELAQTVTDSSDTVITFPRSYLTSVGGWTVPAGVTSLDVLVVGGGGGGGVGYSYVHGGGGGGAGGFREETITPSSSTVQVLVGAGGSGGAPANPGGGSSIDTVSVAGGGRGGSYDHDAGSGGSGGGGGHSGSGRASTSGAAAANASYGNSGGSASGNGYSSTYAGGGGGAGGAGGNSADNGTGGLGKASTITGTEVYYAGGGGAGGGQGASSRSAGGSAVGGSGGYATSATVSNFADGTNGVPNRGGGGGGGAGYNFSGSSGSGNGGAGGSGVVIVRYSPVSTPDAPSNLSAVTSDGQVDLSWTAPTFTGDSAIADYLVEYRADSGSWQTYNDGVSTTTSATLTGLSDTSTYEFRVSATNTNSNTGTAATLTVSPELEPSFGAFAGTSDGFTIDIDNYDGTYTWAASATNGSVSISGAGVATVTGLDPGETSAVTVTATKTNTFPGSATTTGTAALVVDLDAANTSSYPGTGSTWTNLVDGTDYTISNGSFSSVKGGAIDFNGSSTYVDLNTPLSANSDFTFEAWVFDESSTGSRNILSSRDTPLFISGTTLYGGLGGTYTLVESSGFPQNTWRHVVLTWNDDGDNDDKNRMRLFVNGVQEDALLTSTRSFTQQSLFVGAHPSGGGASFWDGLIAKARVYNEAVSATQVLARYNATRSTYGLGQALNPTFATPTKTASGYTVQISNYDSDFTWSASPSSGSATINGTGLVTLTGLSAGESSTVTVTSTRTGYDQGSATVTSTALDEYTVTYQKGDNGTGGNQTATKTEGSALSLVDESTANSYFTRAGYAVAGWSTNSDGSTTDYELGASYTGDAAVTLYPVWSRATYTITYNNNHSSSQTTADYYSGDTVTLPEPTRSGFDLDGWFTAASGGDEIGQAGDEYSPLAADNLILRYEFDDPDSYDGSGTTVTDTASQVNNSVTGSVDGTLTNGPTFSPLDGQYLEFDGADDYVVTADLSGRIGNSGANLDVSLFAWIYPTGNGVIVTELGQTDISPLGGGLNGWHDSQIEVVNDKLNFGMWTSAGRSPSVTAVDITLNSWHYVGLTYDDSTNTMTAYVDGVAKDTETFQRLGPSTGLHYGLGAGDSTNLGSGVYGNFHLGSFHVYDTGLDAETVERNYQATCARFDDSCTQQTVYAQWTQASATVTFNKGSASGASGENQTATKIYGTDLTLPDSSSANSDFTRAGYYVAGWSESADGSTTDYALGGTYTADAADTLYPVWEPNYCVPASGDSYVNSGSGRSTTVYGLGGHLVLKNASSSTSNSYNRVTYLEFDYDSDDTWDGAQLEVTVTGNNQGGGSSFWRSADPFELKVFGVNSASWDESTLTFSTANASSDGWGLNTGTWPWQPDSGELLGTIDIPTLSTTVGQTYGLSGDALDSFLNDDADGEVTFFLVRTDTDGQSNLSLASRENTSYAAPTLRPVKESTSCAYSVTYSKGTVSGAAGSNQSDIKVEGSDVTLPNSATADSYFTKSGYSVSAWSTRADGTTSDFSLAGTYSTDAAATLYPVWDPDVYTVTYNYDGATGGNSTTSEEYTYDGAAIGLPSPTKTGYTFGGWYSDSGLTTSVGAGGASYTPTADINLYAEWTAGSYTVLYEYNGATAGNSTTSETYSTGGTDITLPTPTRTGYTFGGWYSDLELTSQVGVAGDAYSPTVNLTLYAKWTGEPRSVTYMNPESLTGSVPTDSTDYVIGDTVVVKLNSGGLQKNGYAFEGWTENSDGTGTVLEPGETLTVDTTDIELYPKWSAVTYSISYNKNGGTGDLSAAPTSWQTGDSNVTLPNTGLTKTGYTFDGWEELGSSVKESYDYFPNYADTTLVARWTIKNISYSFTQGEAVGLTISGWPSNSSANFGTSITLPDLSGTTVTIGGTQHVFVAWEESGTTYDSGESFILGDTAPTFTAEWAELYDVRYVFGGGTHSIAGDGAAECDTNSLCVDGEEVSLRSAPERPGYTFTGWTDQSGGEFDANETVNISSTSYLFYAQWTAITYRFSFNSLGGSANPARQDKTIGQLVTMPSAGSRTGYTFGGWSADGGSTVYIDGSTFVVGSEALSFSAQWVPDDYTITYDWTGGSSATPDVSDTYTVGTGYMTLPTASGASYTRDGYTFSGWSTTPDGSLITNYLPTADDVLYAVWADGTYEITYNAYGGIPASSQAFVIRTESVTLPTPVRSDFTFIGWFDAETGGNLVGAGGSSFQPEASQTLYARWVQDSLYGVDLATLESATTYTASSSTGTTMTVNHTPSSSSASVAVPAGALPDGTVVTVRYFKDTTRQSELIPDDNSYFFALLVSWKQGSGSTATVPTTAEGKPITVTLNNSNIKAGAMVYQVIGETVTELGRATVDGSIEVELTEDPEIVVAATKPDAPTSVSGSAGDTAVTVSWTAGSNGGSAITGYTVTASPGGQTCSTTTTSCTIRSLTNNTDYTFQVTAQNGLGSSSPSSRSAAVTPVGANYTVTFNSNGGSAVSDGSFFSGASVSAPSSPTLSGFDFAGWTTVPDDDSSEVTFPYSPGVTQNIVLYALWEEAPEPAESQGNDEESSSGGSTQTPRRPIVPGAPGRPAITNPGSATPGGRLPAPTSPDGLDTTKDSAQVVVGGRPVETESSRRGPSGVGVSAGNIDLGLRVDPGSSNSRVVTNPATRSAEIVVGAGESTALNARGFRPNSTVRVSIPGAQRNALARINVDADGSVQGDVRVARNTGEQPIPVGRQIMEIAGVDADGNDTLIEVVINVAQGDPAPERLRDTNEIPSLSPGVSLATSAGVPEQVQIEVRPEQRQVAVLSGDWSFEVTVEEETGTVADESGTLAVRLVQEKTADVSGSGFQPDSRVDVWLFSDPTLLGSVTVSADGSFTTEFYLDPNYATPGEHTLQLQGVGSDGYIKAANLGVEIVQPAAMATESPSFSLLWWILVAALVLALTVILGLARRRAIR